MSSLASLAVRPPRVAADADFGPWFAAVCARLLNETELVAGGDAYRLAELEAYYHGPGHRDPFAHRDPVQLENGRWYFHRTGGEYRGGSFKGLDFGFGDGTAHFGILIRTVVAPDGTLIDGPSLTVDHLLARTKTASPAALDALLGSRKVWDSGAALFIRESKEHRTAAVYASSRVGLSLRRARGKPEAPKFVGKPYRYLTEPRVITKGKPHLVLARHRAGDTPEEITKLTGCPTRTVLRYVADFEAGKEVSDFEGYIGKELGTADLCRLLGTWAAKFGG